MGFGWFPFHRGDLEVAGLRFRVRHAGYLSSRRYLVIHGDERTAKEVLDTWMFFHPGTAFFSQAPTRNIPVLGGVADPNRIFSRAGAEQSVKTLNPQWSAEQQAEALDLLDRSRDALVRHFVPPRGGLLVALHNNSGGYNVNDELGQSDRTSVKEPKRPHEFFLCTDERDFEALAASPYNVVLQNRKPAADDGSLSRFAATRGFRYVNLETTLGYYEAQMERLEWLHRNVPARR